MSSVKIQLQAMVKQHWKAVSQIYEQGIKTGNATFEAECPDWNTWDKAHRTDCRLVAFLDEKIVGWAALSDISERCVYSGVAEVSVYVDKDCQGIGIGQSLLDQLINESEKAQIWTLQAGIFPENQASIRLHLKSGFRIVGTREKLGKMAGVWRNVVLVERRSAKVE